MDGQGYSTANVHGRWVWVHDPHPDDPGLNSTALPDPRTLLRRLAPAARFQAATRELRRAESAWRKLFHRYQRTGNRGPLSVWNAARNRVQQAQQNAVQIRREIGVTEVTLTYSGIGQPQYITAPGTRFPSPRSADQTATGVIGAGVTGAGQRL